MKLYFSPGACSLSPHIVAREAGIDLKLEKTDTKTKRTESGRDFWEINPKGYVPALEIADGTVAASGTPREIFGDGPRLAALGLAPPEPTQVLQRLRERGFHVPGDAVTPEEVEQALAALLEGAP